METNITATQRLQEHVESYIQTNVELFRLKTLDKTSDVASSIISGAVIFALLCVVLIVAGIGAALWIGRLTGSIYTGFFVTAGIFLVAAFFVYVMRRSIGMRIKNAIVEQGLE